MRSHFACNLRDFGTNGSGSSCWARKWCSLCSWDVWFRSYPTLNILKKFHNFCSKATNFVKVSTMKSCPRTWECEDFVATERCQPNRQWKVFPAAESARILQDGPRISSQPQNASPIAKEKFSPQRRVRKFRRKRRQRSHRPMTIRQVRGKVWETLQSQNQVKYWARNTNQTIFELCRTSPIHWDHLQDDWSCLNERKTKEHFDNLIWMPNHEAFAFCTNFAKGWLWNGRTLPPLVVLG